MDMNQTWTGSLPSRYYCHAIAENCMPGAHVVFAALFSIFSISFSLAGKRVGWWVVGEVVVEKLEKEGGRLRLHSAAPLPIPPPN
jgi:hypothetical protein